MASPLIYVRSEGASPDRSNLAVGRRFLRGVDYPARGAVERGSGLMLVRSALPFEARETSDGGFEITGYGLEWGQVADIGWFTEEFSKGAFADVLAGVRLKVGHDYRRVALARSPKTMRVWEDDTGLGYEATLDLRSQYAQDLAVAVERGDVDSASIGFTPGDYEYSYDEDEDRDHYVNTKVRELYEVSAVDFPAYTSSSIGPREAPDLPDSEDGNRLRRVALKARLL